MSDHRSTMPELDQAGEGVWELPAQETSSETQSNTLDLDWLLCQDLDSTGTQTHQPACADPFAAPPATTADFLWNSTFQGSYPCPPYDPSGHIAVQLLMSQVNSLLSRIDTLETSLQNASKKVEELSTWSRKMEKHGHDMNGNLLELFRMVQKPEFLQSVLDGTASEQQPAGSEARRR